MKKAILALLLLLTLGALVACSDDNDRIALADATNETIRIAFIHVGGIDDQGYTYRQHAGTLAMAEALNIDPDEQIRNFFNTAAGEVPTAINEAIDWGAHLIFGTSFGFGGAMLEAARVHEDVMFFHATGNLAVEADLPNFFNYFGNMSQARFLSGIAAGLRTETNVLGFVGAHPNGEVITGLTAFFLGARSVNPDVTMYVTFINQWNNPTLERQGAEAIIARGADVLGQHVDSPATQFAAQDAGVWGVGYNNNVNDVAPDAVLLSPMFAWDVYLIYAVQTILNGGTVRTDVLYGLNEGMVLLSPFNPVTYVSGMTEAIAREEARLRSGALHIFTGPLYSNEGVQVLAPGEEWHEPLSAPSWTHIIEGITVIG